MNKISTFALFFALIVTFATSIRAQRSTEPVDVEFTGGQYDCSNRLSAPFEDRTICELELGSVEIFEIQGSGTVTPFEGLVVSTDDNIVTAVGPVGFYIQTPTDRDDGDPATSNGIYVFTGSPPTVSVGD